MSGMINDIRTKWYCTKSDEKLYPFGCRYTKSLSFSENMKIRKSDYSLNFKQTIVRTINRPQSAL